MGYVSRGQDHPVTSVTPMTLADYARSGVNIENPSPLLRAVMKAQKSPKVVRDSATVSESLGGQLRRLRVECNIPVEDLATVLDVAPRSVYKHLSDRAVPRRSHIIAYEALFSEKLHRKVILKFSRKVKVHVKGQ